MRFSVLLFTIFAYQQAFCQAAVEESLIYDDEIRTFRVLIPEGFEEGQNLPLVFNFHATGANAASQEVISLMNPLADEFSFFVCYPDALNLGFSLDPDDGPDDIGFVNSLIDLLYDRYAIDTTRVFATGLSGGGFFSYFLACNLSNRIRKIASVAGAGETSDCLPDSPVSIMEFHGTDDPIVRFSAAQNTINYWRNYYQCSQDSTTTDFEDIVENDGSTVQRIEYEGCSRAKVIMYKIMGGGHTWPGGAQLGTNFDISASREMVEFFMTQEEEEVLSVTSKNDKIKVYPNPFSDVINIEYREIPLRSEIAVLDLTGKVLSMLPAQAVRERKRQINPGQLPGGTYLLRIKTETGMVVRRITRKYN